MVGSHVLKHLLDTHPTFQFVAVCGWEHKGEPEKIIWAMGDNADRVHVVTHDLSKPFTARTKRLIGVPDVILNIASESHVERSIEEPVDFTLNNVNLTLNLLEFARETKPKLFLQFSTDEVYGVAKKGENHAEWSSIVPSNPYAASKACQEAIAISYWRTFGVPVVITNTMNVFSPHQDWEKYIPLCVKTILEGGTLSIHSYPGAKEAGSRYYIHADSVAEAIDFIMSKPILLYPASDKPERFNIVGDKEVDNLSLALRIGEILNKEVNYQLVDAHSGRPGHDVRYALDGSKLRQNGWEPSSNFEGKLIEVVKTLSFRLL